MIFIFYEEMCRVFSKACRFAYERVFAQEGLSHFSSMFKFPRVHGCCGIILIVHYIPSALEHKCFEPVFTKLLGSPSSADTGADHNSIECVGTWHGEQV